MKNSFAITKLQYLLRTAPCFLSDKLSHLDDTIRELLSAIANIRLDDSTWAQASLPGRWGGVGIRSTTVLAPSTYLASRKATDQLVSCLLPDWVLSLPENPYHAALDAWFQLGGVDSPSGSESGSQRAWDDGVCAAIFSQLLERADPINRARLLASVAPSSGIWLHALPCSNLGLCLGNQELRVAIGLRIGASLVRSHRCVCGTEVGQDGHHGLACRKSAGRHRRHALANDVIVRAIRSIDVHAELEPPRLLRGDGKRPDGATLDPWQRGKYLVWDFTCPDTLAPSHISLSSREAGSVAANAEAGKLAKYAELATSQNFQFVPIAIETLEKRDLSTNEIYTEVGARIATRTGVGRSIAFFKQRLANAI